MSSESIDKLWDCTITVLKQLVQEEEVSNVASGDEYIHNAKLYVRYNLIFSDLNKVYDSCVQAQKRLDIKLTLEHIICRVISLRNFLAKLPPPTQSSSCELDLSSALIELKIAPSQLEALTPSILKEGTESVSKRTARLGATISSPSEVTDTDEHRTITLSEEQDTTSSTGKPGIVSVPGNKENNVNTTFADNQAAAKIQALYRGSSAREQVSNERLQLDNLIGMSNSSKEDKLVRLNSDIAHTRQLRAQEQTQCQHSYETELIRLKDTVLEEEGFTMQMELREERIRWITERAVTNHELPGSLDDFYNKDASQTESVQDDVTTKKELEPLKACIEVYEKRWKGRVVGPDRIKSQSFDSELAKDLIVRNQVRADLIPGVDENLLSNLQKIKATHEAEKKKKKVKTTKGKKSGKKKGGGKKEKPLPGTKLSEVKDMNVKEMLEILIQNGLIYEYDDRHTISDFVGHFEATDSAAALNTPNAWQIRKAVMDLCILPMGSKQIKTRIQDESIRSILFYGPEGSGKTFMTEIVASEVGALVIHLSSTSIGNTFGDGDDATKLIHMIFTVAKEESLSPVIIYLDDCHEFFIGKSKKKGVGSEANNITMKRFQKDLLVYKNQYLTKEDRVLVIGCTNMPEMGDVKLMKWKGSSGKAEKQGFFEHALYLPNTSHSGRSLIWKEAIRRKVIPRCNLDFTLLAHISSGYSAGKIFEIVGEVLSDDDGPKNITEHDFGSKLVPITKQNDQQFVDFRRQWNGRSKKNEDDAALKKKKSK